MAFSSVQSLSHVQLFVTPWITAQQASLSIINSQSLLKLMPIESVMPSSHLILCRPFSSCPQSLPASGSFPMSQLFEWGSQSIGVSASASVLPVNTQDWSPLGWTGMALRNVKYSGINLTTDLQTLYVEKCNHYWEKSKKFCLNWRLYCVQGLKDSIL